MYYKLYLLFLVTVVKLFRYQVIGRPLTSGIFKGILSDSNDDLKLIEMGPKEIPKIEDSNIINLGIYGRSLYGQPDFNKTGNLVAEFEPNETSVNPEEMGSYWEGDILMPQNSLIFKNGINSKAYRWPNGEVPFEIADDFTKDELDIIAFVIDEYHAKTCIRFKPHTTEFDYISLVRGNSGCWSAIGRVGGKQEVNLQAPGCFRKLGTPIHELMHVLGFMHEQNREERDSFVKIQFQNVQRNAESNFMKMPNTFAFDVGYDYGSVMHYSPKAFSRNGQPTILAKKPVERQVMGQRDGFSILDIEKVNRMYNCKVISKPQEPPIKLPERVSSGITSAQNLSNRHFGTLIRSIFNGFNTFGNFI